MKLTIICRFSMNQKAMIAILVATLMVISGATLLVTGFPTSQGTSINGGTAVSTHTMQQPTVTSPTASGPHLSNSNAPQAQNYLNYAKSHGIPTKYVYLPNFMSTSKISNGHITPGYAFAPAPMGIGDYGLYNNSGVITTYNYTTSSYEAQVNLSYLNDFYLLDNFPTSVTFQLNAVLNNVALFGNSTYQMWTQDVVDFSARTMTLQFVDNVWNFSSPAIFLTNNAINYSSAVAAGMGATGGGYHYGLSPIFKVSYPMILTLYMNTTLNNSRSTVYFNYSLSGVGHGTYDEVIFNSTYGHAGYAAPAPHYFVSGTTLTNTGFIPFDSEIMIGGPGGGSTATVYGINGTMHLKYYNATTKKYQNIRAAYDIGSETGETSVGVDVSYSGTTAYLNPGPSLVYGLWNNTYSQTNYKVTATPGNAFVFVQNNASLAAANIWAWAPMPFTGTETFTLPTTGYNYTAMLNDFAPASGKLAPTTTISLAAKASEGIYTPIVAMSNSQLSTVVSQLGGTGSGTAASPYRVNADSSMINATFGSMNDYTFPAFGGILLLNTTDHLILNNTNLPITYTGFNANAIAYFEAVVGLAPQAQFFQNQLSVQLYNVSNVTITNTTGLQTWYDFEISTYFYTAAVNIWNSTNVDVVNNLFVSEGMSILIYNSPSQMGNNLVTENMFLGYSVENNIMPTMNATYNGLSAFVGNFNQQMGLFIDSGGNMIYGNAFLTQTPVINPLFNIWEFAISPGYAANSWDSPYLTSGAQNSTYIAPQFAFSGLGNYYWNYNGQDPVYDNYGAIALGGDFSPGILLSGSNVDFLALNVNHETSFLADLGGLIMQSPTSTAFLFYDFPAGVGIPYFYNFSAATGYVSNSGFVMTVAGNTEPILIQFTTYTVTFTETGLKASTGWNVDFGSSIGNGSGSAIAFTGVVNGSYTFYVPEVSGYTVSTTGGMVVVNGNNIVVPLTFTPVPTFTVVFTETGLSAGTNWSVTFDGKLYSNNTTTITISGLSAGSYSYVLENVSGYNPVYAPGILNINGNTDISVAYSAVSSSSTSSTTLYEYLAIGAVVGLIIGGLAVFFIRKPPVGQP